MPKRYTRAVSTGRQLNFGDRARQEADRYGADPWIFIRELLQNGRDAGASQIEFHVAQRPGWIRLSCRDDGEGMSFAHAQRYLFSLYSSSKKDDDQQAGRFGVGFWSILRFDPTRIIIRSSSSDEEPWQVSLDGSLRHARRSPCKMPRGTEIILERQSNAQDRDRDPGDSEQRRVLDAATQNGRFLCQRDRPDEALAVLVNNQAINQPFDLPPPSSRFHRGADEGIVGLGPGARVELFSKGLRVRSAACLDDLLCDRGHTGHSRVRFVDLPGSLAPQVLLRSNHLEPMLSLGDARDTKALRRLVALAHRELRLLIEAQIDRAHPPGALERVVTGLRRLQPRSTGARAVVATAFGGLLGLVLSGSVWLATTSRGPLRRGSAVPAQTFNSVQVIPHLAPKQAPRHDRSLAGVYQGPEVSKLELSDVALIPLRYSPEAQNPKFVALRIAKPGESRTEIEVDTRPYISTPCRKNCLAIELLVAAEAGPLVIPVPTGQRLDSASLTFGGARPRVAMSTLGEPLLLLNSTTQGTLRYRTGASSDSATLPPWMQANLSANAELPEKLQKQALALQKLDLPSRVQRALDLTRSHVAYDTGMECSAAHRLAIDNKEPFIVRALAIGRGDCDVQNGILLAILHAADVPAYLAIGYVGHDGRATPWMHAWVVFLGLEGRWKIADATTSAPPDLGTKATTPLNVATTSTGTSNAKSPASRESRNLGMIIGIGGFGAHIVLLGYAHIRGRTRRAVTADESIDIAALLRGALERPLAFHHLPALFHRKLVPLRTGSHTSLNRARALADSGRLYVGTERTEFSRRAVERGIEILDADRSEALVVADNLGATDLDRWGERLAASGQTPRLKALNEYLREHRAPLQSAASTSSEKTSPPLSSAACHGLRAPMHPTPANVSCSSIARAFPYGKNSAWGRPIRKSNFFPCSIISLRMSRSLRCCGASFWLHLRDSRSWRSQPKHGNKGNPRDPRLRRRSDGDRDLRVVNDRHHLRAAKTRPGPAARVVATSCRARPLGTSPPCNEGLGSHQAQVGRH